MRVGKRTATKVMAGVLGLVALAAASWWALFALKPYDATPEQMRARYAHGVSTPPLARVTPLGEDSAVHGVELELQSFDGSPLSGRLLYPGDPAAADKPYPLLIGLHALGRSHYRWWVASTSEASRWKARTASPNSRCGRATPCWPWTRAITAYARTRSAMCCR